MWLLHVLPLCGCKCLTIVVIKLFLNYIFLARSLQKPFRGAVVECTWAFSWGFRFDSLSKQLGQTYFCFASPPSFAGTLILLASPAKVRLLFDRLPSAVDIRPIKSSPHFPFDRWHFLRHLHPLSKFHHNFAIFRPWIPTSPLLRPER